MTAEGAIEFEALEAQAASLMSLFGKAGYERVAPAFIQPASLFLDRIGEALRARTYVFTDPNGDELCLRPEMTIPVCRVFLERGEDSANAKYCYNGPAFRIQEGKPDLLRPREFRQAGIEFFGECGEAADLEVFRRQRPVAGDGSDQRGRTQALPLHLGFERQAARRRHP